MTFACWHLASIRTRADNGRYWTTADIGQHLGPNMSPEAAERLTMEMAAKSGAERTLNSNNLPKIDGRPGGT